jgi:hypothetical protein
MPFGAIANVENCIGVVRIKWGLDANCTAPFVIDGGRMPTSRSGNFFGQASTHYAFAPEDANEMHTIVYYTGADPSLNQITWTYQTLVNPSCDQIQDVCINVSNQPTLGSLVGPYDIIGETESGSTYIAAENGPSGNFRFRDFTPPEIPLVPQSGWWELPNLPEGDYDLRAESLIRAGRAVNRIHVPSLHAAHPQGQAHVVGNVASDVERTIHGQTRYPFLMRPAFIQGSILLSDPFIASHPGTQSTLSALYFDTDHGRPGPDATRIVSRTRFDPAGRVQTEFPGSFDIMPLLPGGTATIGPVTWSGAAEGQPVCFQVSIHDEALQECCAEKICVTAPMCTSARHQKRKNMPWQLPTMPHVRCKRLLRSSVVPSRGSLDW